MNTNGNDNSSPYGHYCYDFMALDTKNISSDYLAVLGAFTRKNDGTPAEAAQFCGIFDDVRPFKTIESKFCLLSNGQVAK